MNVYSLDLYLNTNINNSSDISWWNIAGENQNTLRTLLTNSNSINHNIGQQIKDIGTFLYVNHIHLN